MCRVGGSGEVRSLELGDWDAIHAAKVGRKPGSQKNVRKREQVGKHAAGYEHTIKLRRGRRGDPLRRSGRDCCPSWRAFGSVHLASPKKEQLGQRGRPEGRKPLHVPVSATVGSEFCVLIRWPLLWGELSRHRDWGRLRITWPLLLAVNHKRLKPLRTKM